MALYECFLRPVVLEPDSEQTIYMLVCTGDKEQVQQELQSFHSIPDKLIAQVKSTEGAKSKDKVLPGGEKYLLGNRLLQASLLSNIVYPVYTQKEYIRHFTPGKNWNSLYTWDSGFIALGLIDVDPAKAFECIKAYTTPVGSESALFIMALHCLSRCMLTLICGTIACHVRPWNSYIPD